MAKRDKEKTARNKRIKEISEILNGMLEDVLWITGYSSQQSLHAKIGGKHAQFYDVRNIVIHSPEQYQSIWLDGLMSYLNQLSYKEQSNNYELLNNMQESKEVMNYVMLFLERSYLKHYDELSKVRPKQDEAMIWIGQNNADYGIFVTPRFSNGEWENDGSEIRKFKPDYFTIGHILKSGLVIPDEEEIIHFDTVKEYLSFFKNVLVRNSGSKYERQVAKLYCEYVLEQDKPKKVPLLIPEYRYGGKDKKHKYRLDFTVINPYNMKKVGFELSPWSTHGYLSGTKGKSQKEINKEASDNFEKEMKKHKSYYKKFGVFSFIYTDSELSEIEDVFDDIIEHLNPKKENKQLQLHIMKKFKDYK
jgi:hypothetical protein